MVESIDSSTVQMHYFNNDGTPAELCVNGVRCTAKYAVDNNLVDTKNLIVKAPVGDIKSKEPMDAENFLDKMQDSMQSGTGEADIMPNPDVNLDAKPVMPELPLRKITPPKEMEAKVDAQDIFIG